jgi:hypothetical protein
MILLEEAAVMLYVGRAGPVAVDERVGAGFGATGAFCSIDSTSAAGESSRLLTEAA